MAKHISLKAELRANPGTTGSKAVRKAGKVPAVIYGRHFAPQTLQLDAHTLALTLRGGISHALVDLEIVGGTSTLALIQAVQHHPVKRHIVHLDFHALKEDELMHTTVPIVSQGEPLGVKTGGGRLEQIIRNLEVSCFPKDLPESLIVDVSGLNQGDYIHVNEIALPAGVTSLSHAESVVFHCAAPTVEVVETPVEGAATPEVTKEKKPAAGAAPAAAAPAAPAKKK